MASSSPSEPTRARGSAVAYALLRVAVAVAVLFGSVVPPQLAAQSGDALDRVAALASLGADGRAPPRLPGCETPSDACLREAIAAAYADDAAAGDAALALFARHGTVAGVEAAFTMDGGFRGLIDLVPARPVGRDVRHLRAVLAAHDSIEETLASLREVAVRAVTYRHRALVYRFTESVGRTTPSAYASEWHVAFNVRGSLHRNPDAVRRTIVHEVLHLNEGGAGALAERLRPIHARILARCGTRTACLAPYAPQPVRVRGGTYYAFQPDNGDAVDEYAADLASRFLEEQRAALRGARARSWKCQNGENAEAYEAVAAHYFGGADRTRACD